MTCPANLRAPIITMPTQYVAIDTETTGLDVYRGNRPFAWAAAFPNGTRVWGRNDFTVLRSICEDPNVDKVFHNAKFDWRMIRALGIEVRGKVWDTAILAHLIDGRDAEGGLSLDDTSRKYLPAQYRKVVDEIHRWFADNGFDVSKKKKLYGQFNLLPNDILQRRVVGDAELTLLLFQRLFPTVAQHFPFLLDQERRLIPIVMEMEDRGVLVDPQEIEVQIEHFNKIVDDVILFCEGVLDDAFNINSIQHQRELLKAAGIYDLIPNFTKPGKKRKSTKPFLPQRKMDAWNLQMLHHPVAWMLLVGKAAQKMISPFLTAAQDLNVDGVLHPSYKQYGTTSGRFSCADPNLQNIPTEGDRRASYTEDEAAEALEMTGHNFAPHIKRIFRVRDGYVHVHSDKKQAEMVALAHYARDEAMKAIFLRGESIHDGICKLLFHEVTKGLKQRSKAVTFGYQYGAGLATTARKANVGLSEAHKLRQRYAQIFPSLGHWRKALEADIRARGYVTTDHGRRHYLWVNKAYMAVNRVCQGTIGDEVKSRMVAIGEWLKSDNEDARIVLNIHDDLATEMRKGDAPRLIPRLHEVMEETSIPYFVPLPSSLDITDTTWAALKEIKDPRDPSSYPVVIPGYENKALSSNKSTVDLATH